MSYTYFICGLLCSILSQTDLVDVLSKEKYTSASKKCSKTNLKLTRTVDIGNVCDLDHAINLYITNHDNH